MGNSVIGKKIGMTQIFNEDGKVIPVTVIDISNWLITQIKTVEKDGYSALQLGFLKKKYRSEDFDVKWLKNKKKYFSCLREVFIDSVESDLKVGMEFSVDKSALKDNCLLDVSGVSRGLGFQGVVKRWAFGGGPSSHGSTFHRIPGSAGGPCSCGRIIKGKKMPGQDGNKSITVRGLELVRVDKESGCLFVKGAVPGKKETLVFVRMQG